jgi:hypothetical protein
VTANLITTLNSTYNAVFWVMTPRSFVCAHPRFGRTHRPRLEGRSENERDALDTSCTMWLCGNHADRCLTACCAWWRRQLRASETSVNLYQTVRRNNPGDSHLRGPYIHAVRSPELTHLNAINFRSHLKKKTSLSSAPNHLLHCCTARLKPLPPCSKVS